MGTFVTPSPIADHQTVPGNLFRELSIFLKHHPIGKVFVAPSTLSSAIMARSGRACSSRSTSGRDCQGLDPGAPGFAGGILSLTAEKRDRAIKLKAYARFGVKEHWIVGPVGRTVDAHQLTPEWYQLAKTFALDDAMTSRLLPGLQLDVAPLFSL
jgi:Uma2 family endonuclease